MDKVREVGRYLKQCWMGLERKWKNLILALFAALLVGAIGYGGLYFYDRAHMNKVYQMRPTETVSTAVTETPIEENVKEQDTLDEEKAQRERFATLIETNEDVVGWISVSGTDIDLPILQADDNEYYLKHDLYHEDSSYGVPFVDYECDVKSSPHLIIYGHTMSRTSTKQFSQLKSYQDPEYCKENPVFQLDTLYKSRTYKVMAAYIIPGEPTRENFFSFNASEFIALENEEIWQAYLDEIERRAFYTVDGFLEPGEEFVSLCTCSKLTGNDRIVIVARPLRDGESAEAGEIIVNPQPVLPGK